MGTREDLKLLTVVGDSDNTEATGALESPTHEMDEADTGHGEERS